MTATMSGLDRESAVASPVTGDIELVRHEGDSAVTSVQISPQEQVFAGHYPSFPIFPGICIVECVLRSARLAPAAPGLRLAAVESTRFQDPVFPGDILMIELTWSRHGEAWRCRSEARTARGRSAQVRLRFDTLDAAC